jgi:hypothetical protein
MAPLRRGLDLKGRLVSVLVEASRHNLLAVISVFVEPRNDFVALNLMLRSIV